MLRLIYTISRYLLALLFLFSGGIKCLDPMGTEIKLGEYLSAFSLEFFLPVAAGLAVVLSALELILGLMLLVGAFKRLSAIATTVFMTVFTMLTLVILITNPVSDCGCFGDVVILSNSATFYKNCIFEVLALFLLYYSVKYSPKEGRVKWYEIVVWGAVVLIPIYSYLFLPAVEVLPFKIGANLSRVTAHPVADDQPIVLLYRNKLSGETQKFMLDDPEWQDETKWEFVATEEGEGENRVNLVSFDILDSSGNEVSERFLSSPDTLVVVVARQSSAIANNNKLRSLVEFSEQNDMPLILVTSSSIEATEALLQDLTASSVAVYNMDETTIKTLLRASSGAVVLSKGTVLGKWNATTLPVFDTKEMFGKSLANQHNKPFWFAFFATFVLLPLFVVHFITRVRK